MKALFTAVVAAMALACAAPEPNPSHGELHKGAYRPVRGSPTFNPTTDAPHTFRPGQPSPVQPGPRPARVLPQTPDTRKEPGIWAANPPEDKPVVTFNWDVPVPEDDDEAASRIKACAAVMKASSVKALHKFAVEQFDRTNIRWRMCWPHYATAFCLGQRLAEVASEKERALLGRAIDFANQSMGDACSGGGWWSPGFTDAVKDAWRKR
jgi:hypothetical protein